MALITMGKPEMTVHKNNTAVSRGLNLRLITTDLRGHTLPSYHNRFLVVADSVIQIKL